MPYKFNIFTSNFDLVGTSGGSATDNTRIEDVPCTAGTAVGDWVRMNAGTAEPAQADAMANADVIGVVEVKPTATSAHIRIGGRTLAVFVGLDPTKDYFLSDTAAGEMVDEDNVPTDPGTVLVPLGKPFDATTFLVDIDLGIVRT